MIVQSGQARLCCHKKQSETQRITQQGLLLAQGNCNAVWLTFQGSYPPCSDSAIQAAFVCETALLT